MVKLFLSWPTVHRDLHSFPTRRSSDLKHGDVALQPRHAVASLQRRHDVGERACPIARSEEHTSELQSQSNLVCRPLLEKKKLSTSTSMRGTCAGSLNN